MNKSTGGSYSLEDYEGKLAGRNFAPSQMKFVRQIVDVPVDEIYDVESIIDHKEHDGNFLYCVRWTGYNEEDDTWEPPENFGDPTLITKYWKRRGMNINDILPNNNILTQQKRKRDNNENQNTNESKRKSIQRKGRYNFRSK